MSTDSRALEVSIPQRALLMLHELSGRSGGYNLRCALTVAPCTDVECLDRSVSVLIARHELLRSRFLVDGHSFRRFVHPATTSRLRVSEVSVSDREARDTWIARRSLEPFDLEQEDPARFELLELRYSSGQQERILLITVHHVAADYASIQLLVAELEKVYQALRTQGVPPQLPAVVQFDEHVRRQNDYLDSPRGRGDRKRWAQLLEPLPPPWTLRDSQPHPRRPTFEGLEFRTVIKPALTRDLRALARELALTPYLLALSASAVLLSGAAERSEIVLGTTVDGYGRRLRHGGVGYFVNTMPMKVAVGSHDSFAALAYGVRQTFMRSLSFSNLPFASLVEHLRLPRHETISPVCQVMVTWLKFASEFLSPPTSQRLLLDVVSLSGRQPAGVTHDIVLSIEDREKTLHCAWAFDDAVNSPRTVERLAAAFEALLPRLVYEPYAPLPRAAAMLPAPHPSSMRDRMVL